MRGDCYETSTDGKALHAQSVQACADCDTSSAVLHHCAVAKAPLHASRCIAAQRAAPHSCGRPLLSCFPAHPKFHPIPPGPWCASWRTAAYDHTCESSTVDGYEGCRTAASHCIRLVTKHAALCPPAAGRSSPGSAGTWGPSAGSSCKQRQQATSI